MRSWLNNISREYWKNRYVDLFSSGFRPGNTMKTALVTLVNEFWWRQDGNGASILQLLNLLLAFSTIDHNILMVGLRTQCPNFFVFICLTLWICRMSLTVGLGSVIINIWSTELRWNQPEICLTLSLLPSLMPVFLSVTFYAQLLQGGSLPCPSVWRLCTSGWEETESGYIAGL